jgi:hypothetical protein
VTPAQEAKAEVYKELGYQVAGMVGVNLTVARPMVKAQGHMVQVIGPDGKAYEDVDPLQEVAVYCRRSPVEINCCLQPSGGESHIEG